MKKIFVLVAIVIVSCFLVNISFANTLSRDTDAFQTTDGSRTTMLCATSTLAEGNPIDMPPVAETIVAAEGANLAFILPETFTLQGVESDIHTFKNAETGVQLLVCSFLDNRKDQSNLLRKPRDRSNKFVLFEDIAIGENRFLVCYHELSNWNWQFLLLTADGYSYRFFYTMPVEQGQDTMPDEAINILATLRLVDEDGASLSN